MSKNAPIELGGTIICKLYNHSKAYKTSDALPKDLHHGGLALPKITLSQKAMRSPQNRQSHVQFMLRTVASALQGKASLVGRPGHIRVCVCVCGVLCCVCVCVCETQLFVEFDFKGKKDPPPHVAGHRNALFSCPLPALRITPGCV